MPIVWIPAPMRDLTGGQDKVTVEGKTLRQVIAALDEQYPGMKARLCDNDALRPGLAVAIDTQMATMGLLQPVQENSEIHFLPAIGGGAGNSR